MARAVFLVFDIGSSSIRCTLLQPRDGVAVSGMPSTAQLADSKVECIASFRAPVSMSEDGAFDAGVIASESRALLHAAMDALRAADVGEGVTLHVCFSCFAMGLVVVDEATGAPRSRVCTYANRSDAARTRIAAFMGTPEGRAACEHVYACVGAPVHTAYAVGYDLPSLLAAHTCVCVCSVTCMLMSEWARMPPRSVGMSTSECAWAGVLCMRTRTYSSAALALLGVPASAFVCVHTDDAAPAVDLVAPFPQELRVPPSVSRVCMWPGVGDGAAATIAMSDVDGDADGAPAGRVIACTVGTSAAARTLAPRQALLGALCDCLYRGASVEELHANRDLHCSRCGKPRLERSGLWAYTLSEKWMLLGGALTDGGSLLTKLRQLLADGATWPPAYTALASASMNASHDAVSCPPSSDALPCLPSPILALPFLSGERATGWHPAASGVFVGVSHATTPSDMLAAAAEGVALRLGAIVSRMAAVLPACDHTHTHMNGGALTHAREWCAVLAHVFGCECTVECEPELPDPGAHVESTTLGAATFVCVHTHMSAHAFALPSTGRVSVRVLLHVVDAYRTHARRHEALYRHMQAFWQETMTSPHA